MIQKFINRHIRKSIHFVLLFAGLFLAASCTTQKTSLVYFKDISGIEEGVLKQSIKPITIRPDDELQIIVSSLDPSATIHYSAPLYNPESPEAVNIGANPQQLNYFVDSKGDITMPGLGRVHVAGLTVAQLTDELTQKISKDVKDPFVRVELKNFKVQVLGEVKDAGVKEKPRGRETMTVLEALAEAGDMTEYSDRSNILLLRRDDAGNMVYHRLNLNDKSSLESPYFFLEQNDVIIVPPTNVRQENAKYSTNNSFKIQVVSTIVSVVSVIASLVIALAVK